MRIDVTVPGMLNAAIKTAPSFTGRVIAEIVVEAHDTVDLGAAQVEGRGNDGDGIGRYVPELMLHRMENGEEGAGTLTILLYGGGDSGRPVSGTHTAAARMGAPMTRVLTRAVMASMSFRSTMPGPSKGASVARAMRSGSLRQSGARPCAGR